MYDTYDNIYRLSYRKYITQRDVRTGKATTTTSAVANDGDDDGSEARAATADCAAPIAAIVVVPTVPFLNAKANANATPVLTTLPIPLGGCRDCRGCSNWYAQRLNWKRLYQLLFEYVIRHDRSGDERSGRTLHESRPRRACTINAMFYPPLLPNVEGSGYAIGG